MQTTSQGGTLTPTRSSVRWKIFPMMLRLIRDHRLLLPGADVLCRLRRWPAVRVDQHRLRNEDPGLKAQP